MKKEFSAVCDWCGDLKMDCVEHKDMDEGVMGGTYDVCRDCRAKELARLNQELSSSDEDYLYNR